MLSYGYQEAETGIHLTAPEKINSDVSNAFLTYLEGGAANINEDNAVGLLQLAQENNIPNLAFDCLKVIEKTFKISNLSKFKNNLKAAVDNNLIDLKWQCMIFASQNYNKHEFLELLGNTEISQVVQNGFRKKKRATRSMGLTSLLW